MAYDASTPYPGWAALVPTLATAAVILAAIPGRGERDVQGAYGVGRLLAGRAPRAIGRLSYTLYLWHWPVLVLAEARLGTLGWPARTAWTLVAVLPAIATMRWVEQPLRRSRTVSELPRRGLAVGVSAIVLPIALALVVGTATLHLMGPATPVDVKGLPPGAASGPSLLAHPAGASGADDGPVVPNPVQARKDFPPDRDCQVAPEVTSSPQCLFGAVDSPDRIVLLGDSHAGQWFSPMLALAAQRGWALQELVKQGCPLPQLAVDSPQLGRAYRECDTWRADALDRLRTGPKPRLIVIASLNRYTTDRELLTSAWEKTLKSLRAIGAPIVYIEDTPVPGTDIPACVSGAPADAAACAFDRADAVRDDPLARRIASGAVPGVRTISVNPALCPGDGPTCPAVRERVLLYRDDAHLTNAAAVVLTPRLERLLTEAGALPATVTPSTAPPRARRLDRAAAGRLRRPDGHPPSPPTGSTTSAPATPAARPRSGGRARSRP